MGPALVHPEIALALSPERLRALMGPGARGALASKAPLEIARQLFAFALADDLVARFRTVERLANGFGPEALVECARIAGLALDPRAIREGAADVAADVVLASCTKSAGRARGERAARTLARARIRLDRFFLPRSSYELVGVVTAPAPAAPNDARDHARDHATDDEARLAGRLRDWLGDAYRALFLVEDDRQRLHAAVLYEAPPIALIAWPRDSRGRAGAPHRVAHAPLLADIVRIDRAAKRILVTPAREAHLLPLARAFGVALHGDAAHYSERPSFSFKTLQAMGAAGFARHPRPLGVAAWAVIGCQWDSGREERIEVRSDDALSSLEAQTRLDGGYYPRVTLRVECDAPADASPSARGVVDLFVQLPHRITVSDPALEDVARRAASSLGILEPGALPDDLATLAPWVHFEWRWREAFGDAAFAALVKRKILTRARAGKGVASTAHRPLGSSVKLTRVPGEDLHFATPLDFSVPAFDAREDATEAWRLDEDALARHLRAVMGLRPPSGTRVEGVMDLGTLVVKSGRARVFYAATRPRKGLVAAMRAACKLGVTPLVCVPRGRRLEGEGLVQVELDLHEQIGVAATTALVTGRIASALGVGDEIDPWRLAEPDEALVLDRRTKRAWLTGVLLVHLAEGAYRLLERLAIEGGGAVGVKELGAYVSGAASDVDVVVRKARARLPQQVARSFAAAGVVLPEGLVETLAVIDGRGEYRLGVGCKLV